MKKILLLLALACSLSLTAQTTLRVTRGNGHIHEVFTATTEDMTFQATATGTGTSLTIGTITYDVKDITSITIGEETIADGTVNVTYNTDGTADVVIAGNIAPYLTTSVNGQDVVIESLATYTDVITYNLTGTATDGSFEMEGKNNTILNLNGVSITSSDTAAINIHNGKHCTINVNGTNTFIDGATGGQKGAFFCNGHATFTGDGTINITGNARHGYRSDEYTIFSSDFTGNFNVLASASDAMNVQQYLSIENGTFTLSGNIGDGIDVGINNDPTKELNGQLFISGGTINANATSVDTKAIKSDSCLTITGGTFNINVIGNGCKGFKAGTDFRINNGTINMTVSGGSYEYTLADGTEDAARCQGIRSDVDFYLAGDATRHPTFNITNTSTDDHTYGIRVKGWLYYTAVALKASGFNTKDAKWASGQAKKLDSITF